MTRQRWEKKTLANVIVCRHNVDLVLSSFWWFYLTFLLNKPHIVDMVLCAHVKTFCCFICFLTKCVLRTQWLHIECSYIEFKYLKWDYNICIIYQFNVVQFHFLKVMVPWLYDIVELNAKWIYCSLLVS